MVKGLFLEVVLVNWKWFIIKKLVVWWLILIIVRDSLGNCGWNFLLWLVLVYSKLLYFFGII